MPVLAVADARERELAAVGEEEEGEEGEMPLQDRGRDHSEHKSAYWGSG